MFDAFFSVFYRAAGRDYAAKYRSLGQPIHLIGTVRRAVEFSREQRSVIGFEVETLAS